LWTVAVAVPAVIIPGPPVIVVPAVPAVTTNLFAQGTLSAKVSRRTGGVGGVDTTGAAVSLGNAGDLLSGSATLTALYLNSAVLGGPSVANTVKYSVSGVRQTNVVATGVPAP
jgi:cobalamin synthase